MRFCLQARKPLPEGYPLAPLDIEGRAIRARMLARILTIPSWLTHDLPQAEVAHLEACEGSILRILEIDAHGHVWFGSEAPWFCLRPDEIAMIPGE